MTLRPSGLFAVEDDPAATPRRDLVGYGRELPRVEWPGGARVALQVVVNYEEGSERSFPLGDGVNEGFHEFPGVLEGERDLDVESVYEYGSRAGIWRLFRVLDAAGCPVTFFATAVALLRNRAVVDEIVRRGDEVACHGYRWLNHFEMDEASEREWIARTAREIERLTGVAPTGWYCRQMSVRTRRLLVEHGGFLYDSDAYNDDLPYWVEVAGRSHLVVPYTLVVNDAHFVLPPTFSRPDDLFDAARGALDRLCDDGDGASRLMSIGLHARIIGQPTRAGALARFLEYASARADVWIARRCEVARVFASQVPSPDASR